MQAHARIRLSLVSLGARLEHAANLVAALDALDSGITTLVDWSHNNNSPEHADAAIQAVMDSGIRAVWAYGNSNDEWLSVNAARR